MYFGRHFRSADGSVPPMIGPPQIHWGTVSSLTLPADNGTWAVVLVTSSKDTALRSLREADRWEAVVRGLPLVAHWLDGTPIDDGVQVMARLEDRYRGFVVDGQSGRHRRGGRGRLLGVLQSRQRPRRVDRHAARPDAPGPVARGRPR